MLQNCNSTKFYHFSRDIASESVSESPRLHGNWHAEDLEGRPRRYASWSDQILADLVRQASATKSWPKQFIIAITASSRPERDEKVVIYES